MGLATTQADPAKWPDLRLALCQVGLLAQRDKRIDVPVRAQRRGK
jgi:hypothetical protein